jgi:alkylhydroperoxidase/carboxymuconolactone decarboxylase family protein YurZ
MDKINSLMNVYELTEKYPESIKILKELGFGPITNPVMRKTIAKKINLAQAAQIKKMKPLELVQKLAERLKVEYEDVELTAEQEKVTVEDVFKAEFGFVPPGIMAASKLGEDFGNIITNFHHRIWEEERSIPLKFKYLMGLTAAIASKDIERAKLETRKAVLYGADIEMVKETLEMMVWMDGAPTLRAFVTPILSVAEKTLSKNE